ncbi:hypothetical protein D9619_010752 [Psilocybe cf. subviscida]|uniref:Septin-type G domain-containing protein n=1 Tax=Psilocybe cf. subviscida TaxID=2480587 RepID=A0A8H5EZQ5_9AGAR|nr:hypothetical protein D9619_010752 [Psilocybe cf. subviscida]
MYSSNTEASLTASASTVRSMHQEEDHHSDRAGISQTHSDSWEGHVPVSLTTRRYLSEHGRESASSSTVGPESSPRMHTLVLPAPSDSPAISPSPSVYSASESSIASVSSSFFFSSSAPGSPGRSHPGSYPSSHPHSENERDEHEAHPEGLIIPSLSLPNALRRPTPYGQTLGSLRLLVLGGYGAGKSFLTGLLMEDNEDVVEIGTWEDWYGGGEGVYAYGKVLRASTDWVEQHDGFGLERFVPSKNVEIVELPGYSHDADAKELIIRLKAVIETPFCAIHDVLHPETDPSGVIANLLNASSSPLYTALVFLLPSAPTPVDREIIHGLSTHIPVIVLPRLQGAHRVLQNTSLTSAKLSRFRPATAVALRNGLFRSPETASLLRSEAVDRFLKWREVERAVEGIWEGSRMWNPSSSVLRQRAQNAAARKLGDKEWGRKGTPDMDSSLADDTIVGEAWSKAKWEAEWMEDHSQAVARRMRQGTVTQRRASVRRILGSHADFAPSLSEKDAREAPSSPHAHARDPSSCAPFDPLHLPSLFSLALSLLEPLRHRVGATLQGAATSMGDTRVRFALLGGFCVGIGVGFWARVF